jgi:hypothetical protein
VIRARSDAPNGTRGWGDPTIPIHHARAPPELSGWVCGDAQTHTQSKVRKHSAWGRLRSGGSRKNRTDRTHPVSASPWLRMENNVPPEDAETSPHCSHYLGISVFGTENNVPPEDAETPRRRVERGIWAEEGSMGHRIRADARKAAVANCTFDLQPCWRLKRYEEVPLGSRCARPCSGRERG